MRLFSGPNAQRLISGGGVDVIARSSFPTKNLNTGINENKWVRTDDIIEMIKVLKTLVSDADRTSAEMEDEPDRCCHIQKDLIVIYKPRLKTRYAEQITLYFFTGN